MRAVVVRIDSPGGTIGSSEEIHRELTHLLGPTSAIPGFQGHALVASIGSIAASGGYYIAMPAEKVLAEKCHPDGSIGLYTSLPNVSKLANDHGVKLDFN